MISASGGIERSPSERGQVLVLVAISIPLLLGFAGFALDVGVLQVERQRLQAATDSAAIAGAAELNYGDWTTAANTASSLNGYVNGTNVVTVSVNPSGAAVPSPLYGVYAGQPRYLEVILTENVPTFFIRLFHINSVAVQTRAVAGLGIAQDCIYILGGSGTTLSLNNNAKLDAPGCGIIVDSSGSPAISVVGSASLTGASVDSVGTTSTNNSGSITPTAVTGVAPVSDPFGYITPPSYSAASCTSDPLSHYSNGGSSYSVGPGSNFSNTQNGNLTCYTSLFLGSNNDTVTVNPGIYVITGELQTGSGTLLGGNGVTFYLVGNGQVNIVNGATLNFSAPSSGAYDGILFYQDRSDTNAAYIEGGSSSTLNGVLYFPTAALNIGNGTTTTVYTPVVANSLTVQGGSNITDSDYSSINSSDPLTYPKLVE